MKIKTVKFDVHSNNVGQNIGVDWQVQCENGILIIVADDCRR